MRGEMRLFRLFGIQVTANWTWILIVGFLTWLAAQTLTGGLATATPQLRVVTIAGAVFLTLFSLYLHELAHALVARRYGLQVTSISIFLVGANAHVSRDSPSPRVEVLVALSGPIASLLLALVGGAIRLATDSWAPSLASLGTWLLAVNVPLAIFNLLPTYPLDGGRILRGVLWAAGNDRIWGSHMTARFGQLAGVVLLSGGLVGIFTGGSQSSVLAISLLLASWFVFVGSVGTHRTVVLQDKLQKLRAAQVMRRNVGRIPAETTVQEFARQFVERANGMAQPEFFAVYKEEELVGLLSLRDLRRMPSEYWDVAPVEKLMLPIARSPRVAPDDTALAALDAMPARWLPVAVIAEDRLLGLISREDLAQAISEKRGA
jgi:Zn-dependent protease/CBS domain-containing protein